MQRQKVDISYIYDPGWWNEVYYPLIEDTRRRKVLYGGRDSAKSHTAAQIAVVRCLSQPYFKGILSRKTFNTIKDSQYETIRSVVQAWGLSAFFEFKASPLKISCINGNTFIPRGLDKATKTKSLKDPTFIWYEEAEEISEEDFDTMSLSLRNSQGAPLEEIITFNPGSEKSWLVDRFFPKKRDGRADISFEDKRGLHTWVRSPDPTAVILHTCYKHNEYITPDRISIYEDMARRKTQKYKRHGLGLFVEDVEGALWRLDDLERLRRYEAPDLASICVAVDPSGNDGSKGDEVGIVVAGADSRRQKDSNYYVIDDLSGMFSPAAWAKRVVRAYKQYNAGMIVAEKNYGGEMVRTILKNVDPTIPVKIVSATRGKKLRAEPIAALYEDARVFHVARPNMKYQLSELEDEMVSWVPGVGKSPNRLDALVWAITYLSANKSQRQWYGF